MSPFPAQNLKNTKKRPNSPLTPSKGPYLPLRKDLFGILSYAGDTLWGPLTLPGPYLPLRKALFGRGPQAEGMSEVVDREFVYIIGFRSAFGDGGGKKSPSPSPSGM